MSALLSGYISLEKLEQIVATVKAKQQKGFSFTTSINDESKPFTNNNGNTTYQNVSYYAEQSEEQRKAKADKYFFGNGKVFWTDGHVHKAGPEFVKGAQQSPQQAPQQSAPTQGSATSAENLPF